MKAAKHLTAVRTPRPGTFLPRRPPSQRPNVSRRGELGPGGSKLAACLGLVLFLSPTAKSQAQSNGDTLQWNPSASATSWTNATAWYDMTAPGAAVDLSKAANQQKSYNLQFSGAVANGKAAPSAMTVSASLCAVSLTFQNNFNAANTTALSNGSAANAYNFTLGKADGSTGTTATPWTLVNNATNGSVTWNQANAGTTLLLYSNGSASVAGGGSTVLNVPIQDADAAHTGKITKSGAGMLTLSGANTYSGGTAVSAGSLQVSNDSTGSATGSGAVTVEASGTLLGTGYLNAGANLVTVNGVLSPGGGVGSTGTIYISSTAPSGALTLGRTSTLAFDLTGGSRDQVALAGSSLALDGGVLALTLPNTTSAGLDYTKTYALFTGVGALSGVGFSEITGYNTADYRAKLTLTGLTYNLSFTAVPEPATAFGGALAAGALAWSRRRRSAAGRDKLAQPAGGK